MLLLNWLPAPLHRALYRAAHRVRTLVWRVWRPNVEGVRVLALDRQGRVLLIRHSYGSDKWMPPGGGIRRGEDPVLAGARELREEVCLTLQDARLAVAVGEDLQGASHKVNIVRGTVEGEPKPDGREVIEARFFALDALPEYMPKGLAGHIAEWCQH